MIDTSIILAIFSYGALVGASYMSFQPQPKPKEFPSPRLLESIIVSIIIVVFGMLIVLISYIAAARIFQDPPSYAAINIFVTAILGSAVTIVAALQIIKDKI